MTLSNPIDLLGGISAKKFMQEYWQKKPLLIRGAIKNFKPIIERKKLLEMSFDENIESRLLTKNPKWKLEHGPLKEKDLPKISEDEWTLLIQGVDLNNKKINELMQRFRFIPDARLDDVMISYATNGGGVGPHWDSYDVFLLQANGQRKWRIAKDYEPELIEGLPVKILKHFEPEEEFTLDAGDMLYLPPHWAHDGIAIGNDCMTYSIGFRQPTTGEIAREIFERAADMTDEFLGQEPYTDPDQKAQEASAKIPKAMQKFAQDSVYQMLSDKQFLNMLFGEYLSEPKPIVFFKPNKEIKKIEKNIKLNIKTKMLYDENHIFINGEGFEAAGQDAKILHELANKKHLEIKTINKLSDDAKDILKQWFENGWIDYE